MKKQLLLILAMHTACVMTSDNFSETSQSPYPPTKQSFEDYFNSSEFNNESAVVAYQEPIDLAGDPLEIDASYNAPDTYVDPESFGYEQPIDNAALIPEQIDLGEWDEEDLEGLATPEKRKRDENSE